MYHSGWFVLLLLLSFSCCNDVRWWKGTVGTNMIVEAVEESNTSAPPPPRRNHNAQSSNRRSQWSTHTTAKTTTTMTPVSLFLKLQKLYVRQPPHDTFLYDILHVSPNATAADIIRSYRSSCTGYTSSIKRKTPEDRRRSCCIQFAYDILMDDSTRLLYHRYGLYQPQDAVDILSGTILMQPQSPYPKLPLTELLRLMGYNNNNVISIPRQSSSVSDSNSKKPFDHPPPPPTRVACIAVQLVEWLRPVVEGTLSDESYLMDHIMQMCDAMKHVPLGAHILRCIGRAYRYSGQKYLTTVTQHHSSSSLASLYKKHRQRLPLIQFQDQWRKWKHVSNAAFAQARVFLQTKKRQPHHVGTTTTPSSRHSHGAALENVLKIKFDPAGQAEQMEDDDDMEDHAINSVLEEMNNFLDDHDGILREKGEITEEEDLAEIWKAKNAISISLQVEAIWKVWKIDLDRTIRQACDLIFQEQYFFFTPYRQPPSVESKFPDEDQHDGWVSSTSGMAITVEYAKMRAAQLLIRIGEIMVKRSKQDTAWME